MGIASNVNGNTVIIPESDAREITEVGRTGFGAALGKAGLRFGYDANQDGTVLVAGRHVIAADIRNGVVSASPFDRFDGIHVVRTGDDARDAAEVRSQFDTLVASFDKDEEEDILFDGNGADRFVFADNR